MIPQLGYRFGRVVNEIKGLPYFTPERVRLLKEQGRLAGAVIDPISRKAIIYYGCGDPSNPDSWDIEKAFTDISRVWLGYEPDPKADFTVKIGEIYANIDMRR